MSFASIFVRASFAVVAATAVAACGVFSSDPKIDYKTAQTPQRPLDVPPELSPLPREDRFAIPDRPGVASAAAAATTRPGSVASGPIVAPGGPNARIERAGAQRWLSVDVPPEQAFAAVREFFPALGLKLEREDPQLGILETVWAENRAKIPQDIIRRTIGRLFDGLYSTGEQDKYRARIERTDKNLSEIYLTHRGMVEVYTTQAQDQTRWQPRPPDTELEAEMLQRLLVRFVQSNVAPSAAVAPAAAAKPAAPQVAKVIESSNEARIEVSEPFDRAWRRIGLGLDRGGFTVEDRDRAKGIYFVRYLDPEFDAREREKQGFFSKIFGQEFKVDAQQFRILVQAAGEVTRVSVQDRDGKAENGATAGKIIKQLNDQLR
jgi:outer membrane protein assembly factor BamC